MTESAQPAIVSLSISMAGQHLEVTRESATAEHALAQAIYSAAESLISPDLQDIAAAVARALGDR